MTNLSKNNFDSIREEEPAGLAHLNPTGHPERKQLTQLAISQPKDSSLYQGVESFGWKKAVHLGEQKYGE